ncbi:MAG: RNA polymerase sigma factor [Mycobacteriaceae bacterium]|nr:RNA polymerase sigma factor [Mycobacteriaceae bacterium]
MPAGVEDLLRELAPQVLGVLARRYGNFDAAEDAVQEALIAAAQQWPDEGLPDYPRAWLIRVGARRLTDAARSEAARRNREAVAFQQDLPDSEAADHDDTLQMFFLCCHPVLSPSSAIALTLRAVGGLSTEAIAAAFLVPEATMAQRISRAKQRLKNAGLPISMPHDLELRMRLGSVLRVLYLIFNEGYTATAGSELHRTDLSGEAIRLARTLRLLRPDDSEVTGLLALMLLTDARRPARTGPSGELIPMTEQDRTAWNRDLILEGTTLTTRTLAGGLRGPYQIQAAIAVLHSQAASAETTDWPRILALYDRLASLSANPVVSLNRAVAVAMVHGPAAGLADLADLDAELADSHRLHAVRAHLYEMAGDPVQAVAHYIAAAHRTTSVPEHHYLTLRAARLGSPEIVRNDP